jgi:hypothetical protein
LKNENRHSNNYLSNLQARRNGDDANRPFFIFLRVSGMQYGTQTETMRLLRLLLIWRSWMSVSEARRIKMSYYPPWGSVASSVGIGVNFVRMTSRTRLWTVAALLVLLGTPGLSCFVPQQLLSASENECCRQMGSQCGSKEMSSPQSCCKSPTQQSAQLYIGSGEHFRTAPSAAIAAFLPVAPTTILLDTNSALTIAQFHSPPLSLSEANSVLRI